MDHRANCSPSISDVNDSKRDKKDKEDKEDKEFVTLPPVRLEDPRLEYARCQITWES